jgi:hypothetical protein
MNDRTAKARADDETGLELAAARAKRLRCHQP